MPQEPVCASTSSLPRDFFCNFYDPKFREHEYYMYLYTDTQRKYPKENILGFNSFWGSGLRLILAF